MLGVCDTPLFQTVQNQILETLLNPQYVAEGSNITTLTEQLVYKLPKVVNLFYIHDGSTSKT
jgi:hypothetical protein